MKNLEVLCKHRPSRQLPPGNRVQVWASAPRSPAPCRRPPLFSPSGAPAEPQFPDSRRSGRGVDTGAVGGRLDPIPRAETPGEGPRGRGAAGACRFRFHEGLELSARGAGGEGSPQPPKREPGTEIPSRERNMKSRSLAQHSTWLDHSPCHARGP